MTTTPTAFLTAQTATNNKPLFFERITVYYEGMINQTRTDGSWAFVIYADETRGMDDQGRLVKIAQEARLMPHQTNPLFAKFTALGEALGWLTNHDKIDRPHIVCKGSHLMVTRAMKRQYDPSRKDDYKTIWRECIKLAAPFQDLGFQWISQVENREVRELCLGVLNRDPAGLK